MGDETVTEPQVDPRAGAPAGSRAATAWQRDVGVEPRGSGLFDAHLDPSWTVGGGVNGGFQMAVVGSALRRVVPGKPDPLALSAHFLSTGVPGPAQVRTRLLRDGGSLATVAADLVQEEQVRITVVASLGSLADLPQDAGAVPQPLGAARPPQLPAREKCLPTSFAPPEFVAMAPMVTRFEMLLDPGCVGWVAGEPSHRAEFRAWFRISEHDDPDPLQLLLAVDALPPVTFDLGMPGWAPTVELTAHLRALPTPGWLRLVQRSRNVGGGMFDEDCEVWDEAGRLVAQGRQLARLPRGG